jgi:hypothetical protein
LRWIQWIVSSVERGGLSGRQPFPL